MDQFTSGQSSQLTSNTRESIGEIERMLDDLVGRLRQNINNVQEPKAQALFETSAEVLLGLKKAYGDYRGGGEKAWQ